MGTVNVTEERIELTSVDKSSIAIKQVQSAYKDLRSSIDTVKNALAAVGVTVGLKAMVDLYHDVLRANAALDDFSESTGSSVEKLSALQRVAKVAGFDFGNVTEAMGKMIKGLKGADEQGQSAAAALEFLGIKAKNADGTFRDQGEVMVEVAKKLNTYADSGNKVALVQDLYGKGAQKLLPYLKDLGEQTDFNATVTAKQAAQAEEAEKNINRLKIVMEDARRELVIGITPAITEFTEKLLAATKASGGLVAGLLTMSSAQTVDIAKRIKEIDSQLETITKGKNEPRTLQFGTGVSEDLLKKEREYLKSVQLQQVLAKYEKDPIRDAKDLRLLQKGTLDYETPGRAGREGKDDKEKGAEQIARALQAGLDEEIKVMGEAAQLSNDFNASERAKLQALYDEKNKILIDAYDREQAAAIAHGAEIIAIDEEVAANKKRLQEEQLAGTMAFLGNLASLTNTKSKQAFEIGKVASIASALIKGYEAAVSSYAAGAKIGGPWTGAAFAAASILATANLISNIKSQQFGGGGGGGGVAGGAPVSPTQGASNFTPQLQQPQGSQTAVTVNITGVVTQDVLDQLKEQLTQFFGADGVLIPASSRQASVIATGI